MSKITILNVMLSRGLGGVEQAFLDYSLALAKNNNVVSVINSRAKIEQQAREILNPLLILPSANNFDIFSFIRAKKLVDEIKPDAIICQGGRAVRVFSIACGGKVPIIAPAHNYSFTKTAKADAMIAITEDLKQALVKAKYPAENIFVVPHGIETSLYNRKQHEFRSPPVIGAIGRHVKKKGYDVFIESLALLKQKSISFKAVLAGAGEETPTLKKLAASKGLDGTLEFIGWVKNKQEFFEQIDIFCLPSFHEPFGIVVLEAMAAGVPIVSTASEGPREILTDNVDSLLVPINNAEKLANALEELVTSPEKAAELSAKALEKVRAKYDLEITGKLLENSVIETVSKFRKAA